MKRKNFEERLQHAGKFSPVVPFEPLDRLLRLDFSENNKALTEDILNDTALFSEYLENFLQDAGALYGIGGYGEHRTIYSRSRVFDAITGEEPRRLHLGIDIWGKAGTPVYAPLAGTVHSFAFNEGFGNYGATLILEHNVNDLNFYSLYGHLSIASISEKKEGESIEKGQWIAALGIPSENGNWPPHLHFQLIQDLQGFKGDYPGVCKYSEKEIYLENCPDPDFILNMMDKAI